MYTGGRRCEAEDSRDRAATTEHRSLQGTAAGREDTVPAPAERARPCQRLISSFWPLESCEMVHVSFF